jgi:hypothetical protein
MPSEQRLADRRALNARHYAALTARAEPHAPDRDPERPLRVSADGRGIGLSVTAASAARFLLDQATSAELFDSTPSISN